MDAKQELLILTLVDDSHHDKFLELEKEWGKYFYIKQIFDKPENLGAYLSEKVGILFLEAKNFEFFRNEYYKTFQDNVSQFMYVSVADKPAKEDINLYKALADQILYLCDYEIAKWKSIAILRRYWNTFSKPTTIIHKELIIDFLERNLLVSNKRVELTNQEWKLLKLFCEKIGEPVAKDMIGEMIWGYYDTFSRQVDQLIFKLKKKIGPHFIQTTESNIVKFE